MIRFLKAVAALALAVALALALSGCSKTVTVTDKFRTPGGLYFVCNGPRGPWPASPCEKNHLWRVSRADYDKARVGKSYTISVL